MTAPVEMLVCLLLGVVFGAAAIPKLRSPKGFMVTVLAYQVLPPSLGRVYASLVPPLELLLALLFLSGTGIRSASVVAASLLVSFIIAIGINIVRGRALNCDCFGIAVVRPIGWRLVREDSLLLGATAACAVNARGWVSLEPWAIMRLIGVAPVDSLTPALWCVILTAGVILALRTRWPRVSSWPRQRLILSGRARQR